MSDDLQVKGDVVGACPALPVTALSSADADQAASRLAPHGLQSTGAFERQVAFMPGYDRRSPDPNKNYGVGSMRIRFVLVGELGAVQWLIGTDWTVPSARNHLSGFGRRRDEGLKPMGWDLGYHSPRPMYDGQGSRECDILAGGCYYDGSGLNADLLIEGFIAEGDAYVWRALEAYYRRTFEDATWPFTDDGTLLASVDTHAKRGDAAQTAAPFMSGAVASAQPTTDAQPIAHTPPSNEPEHD